MPTWEVKRCKGRERMTESDAFHANGASIGSTPGTLSRAGTGWWLKEGNWSGLLRNSGRLPCLRSQETMILSSQLLIASCARNTAAIQRLSVEHVAEHDRVCASEEHAHLPRRQSPDMTTEMQQTKVIKATEGAAERDGMVDRTCNCRNRGAAE